MRGMHIWMAALLVGAAASARGQTIYLPLVTQYGGQNPYDYAGHDPLVHAAAAFPALPGSAYGRGNGFAFVSSRRAVVERRPRVFTDFYGPHWIRPRDVTVADVINAAHANQPRYFRKADLAATTPGPVGPSARRLPIAGRGSIVILRRPAARPRD